MPKCSITRLYPARTQQDITLYTIFYTTAYRTLRAKHTLLELQLSAAPAPSGA